MMFALLAAAAIATSAPPKPLPEVIAAVRRSHMLEYSWWRDDLASSVEDAVAGFAKMTSDPEQIAEFVARKFSMPMAAAAALSEAELRSMVRERDQCALPEIDEAYRTAVRGAPEHLYVVAAYASYTSACHHDQLAHDVLPLVERLPDTSVAAIADGMEFHDRILVLGAALNRDPDDAALLEQVAATDDDVLAAALGPVHLGARAELRPDWKAPKASAAARQIRALVNLGLAQDALAALDVLPEHVRHVIGSGSALLNGTRATLMPLDLAAAAFLAGDITRSGALVTAFRIPPAKSEFDHEVSAAVARTAILRELIGEPSPDPFDVLEANLRDAFPSSGVWSQIVAKVAEQGGYQRLAQTILNDHPRPDPGADIIALLPERLRDDVIIVQQRIPLLPKKDATSPFEALLRTPRLKPFAEKRMAAEFPPQAESIDCGSFPASITIPEDLHPLRMERRGNEVAGIAISRALDPMGEVGLGAYWVVHSTDNGATWEPPLYTGLRENAPYVVLPASKLPLISDDGLNVEVQIRELDPSSITFPPVALRTRREESGLYLAMPWSELRRDSDGDGLTDLVEERIVTDPNHPDTDGDGIDDSRDGLPQVAMAGTPNALSEAMAALLEHFYPGAGAAVECVSESAEQQSACTTRTSRMEPATLFIVGDRADFAAISTNRRVVVLTPHELELYTEKFGPTYPADMRYMFVNHAGTKAFVINDESWREDEIEIVKTDRGWEVHVVGGWIS